MIENSADYSDITLLTFNFNREDLTKYMIRSFLDAVPTFKNILIVDNSNETPIKYLHQKYRVINNTNFRITPDFGQVSRNHSCAIDFTLRFLIHTKYVLLCDNDILFKNNISSLLEERHNFDCIGEIGYDNVPPNRIFPYLMLLDVEKFNKENIRYFDIKRTIRKAVEVGEPISSIYGNVYDTGYSFYMDIRDRFSIKDIKISDYCIHLKAGSLKGKEERENFINSL